MSRCARPVAVAAAFALCAVTTLAPSAAGRPSLQDLEARLHSIQRRLDRTTERIESLRTQVDRTRSRIAIIEGRREDLRARARLLLERAAARANELYRDGGMGMLEVVFAAGDFLELTDHLEMLSRVSEKDTGVFTALSRSHAELSVLARELSGRQQRLTEATRELRATSADLQDQFKAVSREYEELKARLARRHSAHRAEGAQGPTAPGSGTVVLSSTGGMACPVAGAVSFVDSWGAPRDGHPHQGVDMMAAYGTPIVAIVSGTVTYAAYDGSGGNMIFLSGDDGNQYWYMHNQENLVGGGHVSVGQQIATVGDTGNAEGTPHLHFEYHPGGGAAVNPYPLVASIC
jgi:murein DD-endopeptidase MepM/ murein hydrolase activator NlpD